MVDEFNVRGEDGNWSDKDIVIALIGPTASGKSSFVEQAAGIEGLSRGGLGSSTEEISVFKFQFPGLVDSSICLVDTPGIDGERDPYDIVRMIYVWFNKTYHKEIGLAGLLYFHPISNNRRSNLRLLKSSYFKRLCQNELNRVILTTMWGGVEERTGALYEDELISICKPLSVKRFLNDTSSAFDILYPIVQATLSRQSTIGRVLLVGRSLAATAIKSLQRDPPPIIIFIGPPGGGKSQFIDCLTQQTAWAHHSLQPQGHPVRFVRARVRDGNGSIVLVDTPGFDGHPKTAEDILNDINDWLKRNYKNPKVAGLVFLQNIYDKRWTTLPIEPMKIVGRYTAIKKLLFVTTHWDRIELKRGMERERQICRPWQPQLRAGAGMDRFDMKTETAWRILHRLL